jgi:hypothetical protein
MAERIVEVILAVNPRLKISPRFGVGQLQRGLSNTPFDEEGFTYGA